MRTPAAALLLLLAAACGDDERVGARGPVLPAPPPTSVTAPVPPPPGTLPVSPPASPAASGDSWAATRVGDTATWEVRLEGTDVRTRITWKATRVEGGVVSYDVTSRTTGAGGAAAPTQSSSDSHVASSAAPLRLGTERKEFDVGGKRVAATSAEADGAGGRVSLWVSPDVPFHGIVRSSAPGLEQVLVSFERAPR